MKKFAFLRGGFIWLKFGYIEIGLIFLNNFCRGGVLLLDSNESVSNRLSQHRPVAHPLGETESQLCNEEFLRRTDKTK